MKMTVELSHAEIIQAVIWYLQAHRKSVTENMKLSAKLAVSNEDDVSAVVFLEPAPNYGNGRD